MANKLSKILKNSATSVNTIINAFSKISSVSADGKILNAQNSVEGEIRELKVMSPYGIASSGFDGMDVQVIINDSDNNVVVGVFDKNKPSVKPGEIIIYSKFKSSIKLTNTGEVHIFNGSKSFIKITKDDEIIMECKKVTTNIID